MAGLLGIMITRYADLGHITGVVMAARKAGHPVRIFLTDEGVRFTRDPKFLELLELDNVEVAACDYICEVLGIQEKVGGITYGSQYDNAGMLHDSERVLMF
jgi:peroxiredoxin family protein